MRNRFFFLRMILIYFLHDYFAESCGFVLRKIEFEIEDPLWRLLVLC